MSPPFKLAEPGLLITYKTAYRFLTRSLTQKVVMASLIVKTVAPSVRTGIRLAAGSTVARRFASSDKEIQHGTIDSDVYPADAVSGAPGQYLFFQPLPDESRGTKLWNLFFHLTL
jgi:hypothetical protein